MTYNANVTAWLKQMTDAERHKLADAMEKQHDIRNNKTVYPEEENILRAFSYFPPEKTKIVVIGQDPYHNPGEAMGMSFSVNENINIPPSLQNIYKEIKSEFGGEIPTNGDLTYLAKQGVLLLNASLTVERNKPNSHQPIWENVTDAFVRICLMQDQPIVFMLWGSFAQKMFDSISTGYEVRKCILTSTHPSPYSAGTPSSTAVAFLGCGHFRKANSYLESFGIEPIKWN